jgi:hypothetical protein
MSYLKGYFVAAILSGQVREPGEDPNPWPENRKRWFSEQMGVAWKRVAISLKKKPGQAGSGVAKRPTKEEARRV